MFLFQKRKHKSPQTLMNLQYHRLLQKPHLGGEIPKLDTGTPAILKFDTSTHHYLKIDMRRAGSRPKI